MLRVLFSNSVYGDGVYGLEGRNILGLDQAGANNNEDFIDRNIHKLLIVYIVFWPVYYELLYWACLGNWFELDGGLCSIDIDFHQW